MKVYSKITLFLLIVSLFSFCSSSPKGIVIFCAGDSITEADYPRFLQRIFNKEGMRAKVLNYGRSGYTSGEYLNFLKSNRKALEAEHPDFILLQLGTNDVRMDHDSTSGGEFYLNMKKIIEIFREFRNRLGIESQILLAAIPPIPEGSLFPFSSESRTRVTEEINPLIKKICNEEKILMVDNYSLFLHSPHFLPEVHPTKEGYRHLAQNWYDNLKPLMQR